MADYVIGNEPWLDNWTTERKFRTGGQGTTFLVKNRQSGLLAVAKLLHRQRDATARRRMFREVTNLIALKNANCKVPEVFEYNTDKFSDSTLPPLYIVMQKIEGKTLDSFVSENPIDLKKCVQIALDLCASIKIANKENIVHRDIKPDNLIIASADPVDVYLVDLGLSFNDPDETDDLTKTDAALDNKFLSLTERRDGGEYSRDHRSDLTGIVGILYFCMTKIPPRVLRDASGLAPHRRSNGGIRSVPGIGKRLHHYESLFDRAFSHNIGDRFQNSDDLSVALQGLIDDSKSELDEIDLEELARSTSAHLQQNDRTTQLGMFRVNAQTAVKHLQKGMEPWVNKLHDFQIYNEQINDNGWDSGCQEYLANSTLRVTLSNKHHSTIQYMIGYVFHGFGSEILLLRKIARRLTSQGAQQYIAVHNWSREYSFNGFSIPSAEPFAEEMKRAIILSLREFKADLDKIQTKS